ncbi:MAG: hypothetical protein WKF76_06420 [Nocardioidaceae bacterium]
MPLRSRRTVEIECLDDFDQQVANGASSMRGWRVQGVDLTARTPQLLRLRPDHAILLGSLVSDEAEAHLRGGGALLFPAIPALPFNPYRAEVYTPDELYAGIAESGYEETPDALVYGWTLESDDDLSRHLGRALHDHAMDDALEELLRDKRVAGVMGGHAWKRNDPQYADAACFGRAAVERGLYVASGGGPGAMEAANLGAYLPTESALSEALTIHRRGADVQAVGDRVGARCLRRTPALAGRAGLTRHPHLVLRPRATERVRVVDREVLPELAARGHPAASLQRRHRVPARRSRHGAGDLPGRLRELLRRRAGADAHGAGR